MSSLDNRTDCPQEETQSTPTTPSQSPVQQAREQVQSALQDTQEGFTFDGIVKSVMESIGALWKALGLNNLISYISNLLGFSSDSENQSQAGAEGQEQTQASATARQFPLKSLDVIPAGGKVMYASSTIRALKEDGDLFSNLFQGQRVILLSNMPNAQGRYKIQAVGCGPDSTIVKDLYISTDDFAKLTEENPGARSTIGSNTYLSGDSISQIFSAQTAFGQGMPSQNMKYIVESIAGRVSSGQITQRRLAFIMGFNNLQSRNLETIKAYYKEIFPLLLALKDGYNKEISLNGIFNWTVTTGGNSTLFMNENLRKQINTFIQQNCQQLGFTYVSMDDYHDQNQGLHAGFTLAQKRQFLGRLTS